MIILLNGSMNSGKTTVAKILVEKVPRTAHIEKLRQFIEWMSIRESIPFNIKNIVSLSRNFAEGNLNVVVSYPVSKTNFNLIKAGLADLNVPIFAFTLNPPLEVVITNRGTRELQAWEVAQIKTNYSEGLNDPGYGLVIDNSKQTAEQTAEAIMAHIASHSNGA